MGPNVETCTMLEQRKLEFIKSASKDLIDLIYFCLVPKVENRASMNEVSTHTWVNTNRFARASLVDSEPTGDSVTLPAVNVRKASISPPSEKPISENSIPRPPPVQTSRSAPRKPTGTVDSPPSPSRKAAKMELPPLSARSP